jgi:hypothetical protein
MSRCSRLTSPDKPHIRTFGSTGTSRGSSRRRETTNARQLIARRGQELAVPQRRLVSLAALRVLHLLLSDILGLPSADPPCDLVRATSRSRSTWPNELPTVLSQRRAVDRIASLFGKFLPLDNGDFHAAE